MKDIYIDDLMGFDEGKGFDSFFLVLAKQQRTTKQNKPYLSLMLGDKKGQIEGRVWELGDPRIAKDFERGDMVKVRGSVSRYDDRAQVKVDQLRKALGGRGGQDGHAASHHMRRGRAVDCSSRPIVASVTNPDLKRLLEGAARRPRDCAGISRGARRAATASRVAGRVAGARGQPAGAGRPRGRALSACSIATCSSPA